MHVISRIVNRPDCTRRNLMHVTLVLTDAWVSKGEIVLYIHVSYESLT